MKQVRSIDPLTAVIRDRLIASGCSVIAKHSCCDPVGPVSPTWFDQPRLRVVTGRTIARVPTVRRWGSERTARLLSIATLCYVRTVTHREMRNSSGEILRAVANGETVRVTNNGRIAALIVPPPADPVEELVEAGRARPASKPLSSLLTIARVDSERSTREIIDDLRNPW